MRRRIRSLIVSIALLGALSSPTNALVYHGSLWDGSGGSGRQCGGFTSKEPDLSAVCNGFSNVASSYQAALQAPGLLGSCWALYTGTSYAGTSLFVITGGTHNLVSPMNNAVSSERFGTWTEISTGVWSCVSPWI